MIGSTQRQYKVMISGTQVVDPAFLLNFLGLNNETVSMLN
jgi:hypothetical protein